jgi:hypothetical protein
MKQETAQYKGGVKAARLWVERRLGEAKQNLDWANIVLFEAEQMQGKKVTARLKTAVQLSLDKTYPDFTAYWEVNKHLGARWLFIRGGYRNPTKDCPERIFNREFSVVVAYAEEVASLKLDFLHDHLQRYLEEADRIPLYTRVLDEGLLEKWNGEFVAAQKAFEQTKKQMDEFGLQEYMFEVDRT